jgi:hypothetical protein
MASDDSEFKGLGEGYLIPISGLLALIFAIFAGATAFRAFSARSPVLAIAPIIFGLVSIYLVRVRQKASEQQNE